MKKSRNIVPALCVTLLLSLLPFVSSAGSTSVQFSSLQSIINNATENSTIYIPSDTYYGVIKVNKTLTLIGDNVILDANGSDVGIIVTANNVKLEGFTITNAVRIGYAPPELSELWMNPEMDGSGIYVYLSINVTISRVTITRCYNGIGFTTTGGFNHVINSTISRTMWGMLIYRAIVHVFNSVIRNSLYEYVYEGGAVETGGGGVFANHFSRINFTYVTFLNTTCAISVAPDIYYSYVNHNNFINNTNNVFIHPDAQREVANWTSNFWSDYSGTDTNLDEIGDTPYILDSFNQDNAPRMHDPVLSAPAESGGGGGGSICKVV